MEKLALRCAAIALVAASCVIARTAAADVVSGTVAGAQVTIRDGGNNVVAQLGQGAYEIVLPVGRYTAVCGNGQPASPPEFLSLSSPVTVNFTCR